MFKGLSLQWSPRHKPGESQLASVERGERRDASMDPNISPGKVQETGDEARAAQTLQWSPDISPGKELALAAESFQRLTHLFSSGGRLG